VLDHLKDGPHVDRTIYVINLFPNKAKTPTNMIEIAARVKNLQFANKSQQDIKLLHRFNEVAALVEALETLPGGNPLQDHDAYKSIKAHGYVPVPRIIAVTPPETPEEYADADFSPEAIQNRASEGERQTLEALKLQLSDIGST
jgi:hypothetical protein